LLRIGFWRCAGFAFGFGVLFLVVQLGNRLLEVNFAVVDYLGSILLFDFIMICIVLGVIKSGFEFHFKNFKLLVIVFHFHFCSFLLEFVNFINLF
jgi:hypothetical protein